MNRCTHYLRIGWTGLCGVLCVLIVVLWLRSYGDGDALPAPVNILCVSSQGAVLVMASTAQPDTGNVSSSYENHRVVVAKPSVIQPTETKLGIYVNVWSRSFWIVQVAHWLLALPLAILAVAPWMRQLSCRFSLRTLLIGATLIAVVLGVVVWAARA